MSIAYKRLDGSSAQLADDALAAFKSTFRGQLLTPTDPTYDSARKVWNGMIDRRPALIVRCTGTADVVRAVQFAREHSIINSVRGGGHNIAGLAICEGGLVIDLSALRGVWVDPSRRTCRAQAGCTLGDVDRETQLHGLAAVLGFVSATGIAGLTTGGGFGYLSRRHGWTCDTVLSMDVVTADGKFVRASADENMELFWALRGGSGNFGIVTSFEYQLFPVGPEIIGGAIAWRAEEGTQVLEAYRQLTLTAPRELALVAAARIAPPAPWLPKEVHGTPIVAVFVCHTGPLDRADAVLAPLRAAGHPVADIVTRRPYTQMQSLLDATQPNGRRYYWKSHYLARVDERTIQVVMDHARRISSPWSAILMFHVHGALNELPADHSPVGNRDAAFALNIAGSWDNPDDDAAQMQWARTCFEEFKPLATGGAYINFLNADEGQDRIEAAYSRSNLSRLAALKRQYDPEGLFQHTKHVSG